MLLVMGAGAEGPRLKLAHIKAFNALETELQHQREGALPPADVFAPLAPPQQAQLRALVDAKIGILPKENQPKSYGEVWGRFAANSGSPSIRNCRRRGWPRPWSIRSCWNLRKRKKAGSKHRCDPHSEQLNELAKALAAAQGERERAEKNSTAAVGKEGRLKRNYADLMAMIARIVDAALRWTRRSGTSSGVTAEAAAQPSRLSSIP